MAKVNKLVQLAELAGFESVIGMLEEATFDSIVPCICIREDCDYTTDLEPDCERGYCEQCGTNTVASCLVLAGLI
jgi:hypothetical protein